MDVLEWDTFDDVPS